jgi:hypothetical protein
VKRAENGKLIAVNERSEKKKHEEKPQKSKENREKISII